MIRTCSPPPSMRTFFSGLPADSQNDSLRSALWKQSQISDIGAFGGLLLIASFALEAWGYAGSGQILRAAVVTIHLVRWVPVLVAWSKVNGLGLALRWVLPCAVGGWLLTAWFPDLRVGVLHLMFIGGAGLLMFAAATRPTSDFIPKVRVSHFIYAALMWVVLLAFWAWKTRREIFAPIHQPGVIQSRFPLRRKKTVTPQTSHQDA